MSPHIAKQRSSSLQNRNIRLDGKRTSIRLEKAMWDAFEDIAQRENKTVGELCTIIAARKRDTSLTAAVRLFIVVYYRFAGGGDDGGSKAARLAVVRKLNCSAFMACALTTLD